MSIESILARRSIRAYTNEPVTDEQVRTLLEAAMAAPSANNGKPWHFVVVRDRKTLQKLAEVHPYGKMLAGAGCAVAVCGDVGEVSDYWIQDCSAATENLLVAVTSIGLGAVWLGVHPREDRVAAVRSVLAVPENVGILNLISIGHPAERKEPRTQYDEGRVHRERW